MPDIEKVKQGLRCCIVRHPDDKMRCPECPYRDPTSYCLNRLKNDALEVIETLSAALDTMTGDDCEECKIDGGEEQQGGEPE